MQSEPVEQWLDAERVRALAESLLMPTTYESSVRGSEPIFGDEFEGFEGEVTSRVVAQEEPRQPKEPEPRMVERAVPEREEPRMVERAVPERGEPQVVVPKVVEKREAVQAALRPPRIESPFQIVTPEEGKVTGNLPPVVREMPLAERLGAFGRWLKEQIPALAYFVCDRNGAIVVDEVGSEKLVKVARTLAFASSAAGRQVSDDGGALGSMHVKIGVDRVMEVIPRQSQFGLVVMGLIVPRPLTREAAAMVSRNLGRALDVGSASAE